MEFGFSNTILVNLMKVLATKCNLISSRAPTSTMHGVRKGQVNINFIDVTLWGLVTKALETQVW